MKKVWSHPIHLRVPKTFSNISLSWWQEHQRPLVPSTLNNRLASPNQPRCRVYCVVGPFVAGETLVVAVETASTVEVHSTVHLGTEVADRVGHTGACQRLPLRGRAPLGPWLQGIRCDKDAQCEVLCISQELSGTPLAGELVGTAEEEAADRAYLASLKEVDREDVLLQREYERNNAKKMWEFKQKKLESAAATASSARRRGAGDAKQKKALEKLQANRKRQKARSTKQNDDDEDEFDDMEEDEADELEDDLDDDDE